jgi:2-methylisocitrate lyase-like PEP mutase family enzyme
MLQHLGFAALASTSAGYAWSTGRADNTVTRDDVLSHLASLREAVDLPINADFESGFAVDPEGVGVNVALAVRAGVAGLSIEDRDGTPFGLYETTLAVERIRAARAAIDGTGADIVLVARTEGLLIDPTAVAPAIGKLVAFAEAGADCLYAPGLRDPSHIAALVRAVAPKPVNVLAIRNGPKGAELADLGVRRISVGGALARVAWRAMVAVAEEIKAGAFDGLAAGLPASLLNDVFSGSGQNSA